MKNRRPTNKINQKDAAVEKLPNIWTHPKRVVRNCVALMPVRSADVLGVILGGK